MNQQNFADDQNPYEYEKPVSASKFRKYGSVATLGLLAIGTAFGGNALAATIMATDANTTTAGATGDVTGGLVTEVVAQDPAAVTAPILDANGTPIDPAIQLVATDPTLPVVQNSPSTAPSNSPTKAPIMSLPVLAVVDYGNVSSATPSSGSGSATSSSTGKGGSTAGSSWGGQNDDRDDDRDSDDRDGDREDNDND
jgi:hypothetical protein